MGKSQRDKGLRTEREFAKLIGGERVPLSGAAGGSYTGDVVGMGMTFECKVRKDGFKQLYAWLGDNDALAIKADRKEWLVVLPVSKFLELMEEKKRLEELTYQQDEAAKAIEEGHKDALHAAYMWGVDDK